jgi:hypothetical protein
MKSKINYKWLSFFLIIVIIGIVIFLFIHNIIGALISIGSISMILKDWKGILDWIKEHTKSNDDTIPSQSQINSGDGYQTKKGDIYVQSKPQDTGSKLYVFEKAYVPLNDEMKDVITRTENFDEKIKFDALKRIHRRTAWDLMDKYFIGKFNEILSLKKEYEDAYKEGLNKFIETTRTQLNDILAEDIIKGNEKYLIQGNVSCGDTQELFNFVLKSKKNDFLKRVLLNPPKSGVYIQFNLFGKTYITKKDDFSNRCKQIFDNFKDSKEVAEIKQKRSELLDLLNMTKKELGDLIKKHHNS